MDLKVYNTLSREKEEFIPQEPLEHEEEMIREEIKEEKIDEQEIEEEKELIKEIIIIN